MQDFYNPAASTLKTITRDPATFRTRDIKPGEDVKSIWDEIRRGRGCVLNPDGTTLKSQIVDDPDKSKFYNKADMLEDTVLFPEELSGKTAVALYKGTRTELNGFLSSGPDWVRFINDLDTDEESDDDESSEEDDGLLLGTESHSEETEEEDEADEEDHTEETISEDRQGKEPFNVFLFCLIPYFYYLDIALEWNRGILDPRTCLAIQCSASKT